MRNAAWAISPFAPVVTWLAYQQYTHVAFGGVFRALSLVFVSFMFVWIAVGFHYYDEIHRRDIGLVVLCPLIYALHALGAFVGYVSQPSTFQTTAKVED